MARLAEAKLLGDCPVDSSKHLLAGDIAQSHALRNDDRLEARLGSGQRKKAPIGEQYVVRIDVEMDPRVAENAA